LLGKLAVFFEIEIDFKGGSKEMLGFILTERVNESRLTESLSLFLCPPSLHPNPNPNPNPNPTVCITHSIHSNSTSITSPPVLQNARQEFQEGKHRNTKSDL
jgi:hypothetical protein